MRLLSISVSPARFVAHGGETVGTGIFKEPVDGPVRVFGETLEGDCQVDRRFHGGPDKAVYVYPAEHYAYWTERLQREDLRHGQFGENLTVVGLLETEVCIGDQLAIGSARFEVTQPRVPCFKLGIRMGDPRFIKAFHNSRRVGYYLRVLQEGVIAAGDAITHVHRPDGALSIDAIYDLRFGTDPDRDALLGALRNPALSSAWRDELSMLLPH